MERNGQTSEWLGISNVNYLICRKDGVCVLLTENEIVAVRSTPTRILMRQQIKVLAIDFDRANNLVAVEFKEKAGLQLNWYQLSESS